MFSFIELHLLLNFINLPCLILVGRIFPGQFKKEISISELLTVGFLVDGKGFRLMF